MKMESCDSEEKNQTAGKPSQKIQIVRQAPKRKIIYTYSSQPKLAKLKETACKGDSVEGLNQAGQVEDSNHAFLQHCRILKVISSHSDSKESPLKGKENSEEEKSTVLISLVNDSKATAEISGPNSCPDPIVIVEPSQLVHLPDPEKKLLGVSPDYGNKDEKGACVHNDDKERTCQPRIVYSSNDILDDLKIISDYEADLTDPSNPKIGLCEHVRTRLGRYPTGTSSHLKEGVGSSMKQDDPHVLDIFKASCAVMDIASKHYIVTDENPKMKPTKVNLFEQTEASAFDIHTLQEAMKRRNNELVAECLLRMHVTRQPLMNHLLNEACSFLLEEPEPDFEWTTPWESEYKQQVLGLQEHVSKSEWCDTVIHATEYAPVLLLMCLQVLLKGRSLEKKSDVEQVLLKLAVIFNILSDGLFRREEMCSIGIEPIFNWKSNAKTQVLDQVRVVLSDLSKKVAYRGDDKEQVNRQDGEVTLSDEAQSETQIPYVIHTSEPGKTSNPMCKSTEPDTASLQNVQYLENVVQSQGGNTNMHISSNNILQENMKSEPSFCISDEDDIDNSNGDDVSGNDDGGEDEGIFINTVEQEKRIDTVTSQKKEVECKKNISVKHDHNYCPDVTKLSKPDADDSSNLALQGKVPVLTCSIKSIDEASFPGLMKPRSLKSHKTKSAIKHIGLSQNDKDTKQAQCLSSFHHYAGSSDASVTERQKHNNVEAVEEDTRKESGEPVKKNQSQHLADHTEAAKITYEDKMANIISWFKRTFTTKQLVQNKFTSNLERLINEGKSLKKCYVVVGVEEPLREGREPNIEKTYISGPLDLEEKMENPASHDTEFYLRNVNQDWTEDLKTIIAKDTVAQQSLTLGRESKKRCCSVVSDVSLFRINVPYCDDPGWTVMVQQEKMLQLKYYSELFGHDFSKIVTNSMKKPGPSVYHMVCPFCNYEKGHSDLPVALKMFSNHFHARHTFPGKSIPRKIYHDTLVLFEAKQLWVDDPCSAVLPQVFVCHRCKFATVFRQEYYGHLLRHKGQTSYFVCYQCAESFSSFSDLFTHYKSKHNICVTCPSPPTFHVSLPEHYVIISDTEPNKPVFRNWMKHKQLFEEMVMKHPLVEKLTRVDGCLDPDQEVAIEESMEHVWNILKKNRDLEKKEKEKLRKKQEKIRKKEEALQRKKREKEDKLRKRLEKRAKLLQIRKQEAEYRTKNEGKSRCFRCDTYFDTNSDRAAHDYDVHGRQKLSDEEKERHDRSKLTCKDCSIHFPLLSDRIKHDLEVHKLTWIFDHGMNFRRIDSDTGINIPYNMSAQRYKFIRKYGRTKKKSLYQLHCPEALHKCDECDYTGVLPSDVQKHKIKKHGASYPYICDTCGSQFLSEQKVTNHLCGDALEAHLAEQKRIKQLQTFICEKCGKVCYTHRQLRYHKDEVNCSNDPKFVSRSKFWNKKRSTQTKKIKSKMKASCTIVRECQTSDADLAKATTEEANRAVDFLIKCASGEKSTSYYKTDTQEHATPTDASPNRKSFVLVDGCTVPVTTESTVSKNLPIDAHHFPTINLPSGYGMVQSEDGQYHMVSLNQIDGEVDGANLDLSGDFTMEGPLSI